MYEKGEDFWHGGTNFERIVSVGVNEAEGRFDGRLKDYGRDWGTPLHKYIVNALARKDDVPQDQISDWIVTNHVIENFRYRKIYLESADSARSWERKVIPTIALSSPQFASEHWLGRFVDLPFQTWNKEYTSGRGFSAEDMRNFAELVKAEIER